MSSLDSVRGGGGEKPESSKKALALQEKPTQATRELSLADRVCALFQEELLHIQQLGDGEEKMKALSILCARNSASFLAECQIAKVLKEGDDHERFQRIPDDLKEIPKWFSENEELLSSVETLNLSNTAIKTLPKEVLARFTGLEWLVINISGKIDIIDLTGNTGLTDLVLNHVENAAQPIDIMVQGCNETLLIHIPEKKVTRSLEFLRPQNNSELRVVRFLPNGSLSAIDTNP